MLVSENKIYSVSEKIRPLCHIDSTKQNEKHTCFTYILFLLKIFYYHSKKSMCNLEVHRETHSDQTTSTDCSMLSRR